MKNIILAFLLLPVICFSQSKFSVGLNVGAKVGLLQFESAGNNSIAQKANIKIGYSVGLDATYQTTDRIFLRSGFGYENSQFGFQTEGVVLGTCIDATNGIVRESNYYDRLSIESIIIPLDLGFVIWEKEGIDKFYFGIGTQYNAILETSTNQRFEKEGVDVSPETFDSEIDASNFSGKLFFGFEYPISKIKISIEPTVKFTPNNFDLNFLAEGSSILEPGINIRLSL